MHLSCKNDIMNWVSLSFRRHSHWPLSFWRSG